MCFMCIYPLVQEINTFTMNRHPKEIENICDISATITRLVSNYRLALQFFSIYCIALDKPWSAKWESAAGLTFHPTIITVFEQIAKLNCHFITSLSLSHHLLTFFIVMSAINMPPRASWISPLCDSFKIWLLHNDFLITFYIFSTLSIS